MAFTYLDSLATNRDKVRFYLGDTVKDEGKRPDNKNFSDAEIAFSLSEGSGGIPATVAILCEVLVNEWRSFAISEKDDTVSFDAKTVADGWDKQAKYWKKKALGTQGFASVAGSCQPERTDGYS